MVGRVTLPHAGPGWQVRTRPFTIGGMHRSARPALPVHSASSRRSEAGLARNPLFGKFPLKVCIGLVRHPVSQNVGTSMLPPPLRSGDQQFSVAGMPDDKKLFLRCK